MQYLEFNECKQRGTINFPIEYYHIDEEHPQYEMPYHWHIEYEIIRILEGELSLSIDHDEFCASKGDIIFINSGSLHYALPNNCIYECIVFDMNMLIKNNDACRYYIDQLMNHTLMINVYFKYENNELYHMVWKLFDYLKIKNYGYELIVKGLLYEILGMALNNCHIIQNTNTAKHNRIPKLKKVFELFEESYAQDITLSDLSKTAGMSPKHFCRFFKEMTHRSPMDYLNYYRIERSCYQLVHTDLSITEVAYNCGFNDLSYFIKTFKRYKGETPNKYRSKLNI